MKKLVTLCLALALVLCCTSAMAKTFTVSHVFATDHPVHVALTEANDMLKELSGGEMELEIYPNGTFANYNDSITAVQMGGLDIACLDSACRTAVERDEADTVILGCLGMAQYGEEMERKYGIKVIDPAFLALATAEMAARLDITPGRRSYAEYRRRA